MIQKVRITLLVVALLLLLSFIVLNWREAPVRFWGVGVVNFPVAFVVIGSAAMGALAMYFFEAYRRSKKKS